MQKWRRKRGRIPKNKPNNFQVVSNNFDFQFEVIKNDTLTKDPNFPRSEFKGFKQIVFIEIKLNW